jgi:hypothetical protein
VSNDTVCAKVLSVSQAAELELVSGVQRALQGKWFVLRKIHEDCKAGGKVIEGNVVLGAVHWAKCGVPQCGLLQAVLTKHMPTWQRQGSMNTLIERFQTELTLEDSCIHHFTTNFQNWKLI